MTNTYESITNTTISYNLPRNTMSNPKFPDNLVPTRWDKYKKRSFQEIIIDIWNNIVSYKRLHNNTFFHPSSEDDLWNVCVFLHGNQYMVNWNMKHVHHIGVEWCNLGAKISHHPQGSKLLYVLYNHHCLLHPVLAHKRDISQDIHSHKR